MRTWIYVDGFNLYYGALKGTPYKWLDLVELARRLLPAGHVVDRVNYFSARVSGVSDPEAPARQHAYLRALRTFPEIRMHFGSFLAKAFWRPITNLPIADKRIETPAPVTLPAGHHPVTGSGTLPVGSYPVRSAGRKRRRRTAVPRPDAVIAEVHTMEEKGSDVNLAAHLLNDAWKDRYEVAVVISNDTDLVTPIRMVTTEREKPVFVVCPGRWRIAPKLEDVASHVRHIRRSMLQSAQLPERIPGTTICKPEAW